MTCMCMWLNHYSVAGWILSLCLVQMLRWCCLITTFKIPGRARSFKATTIFSMNPGKDSGCIWGVVIAWHFCMGLQSLKIFSCQERPAQGLLSLRAVSQEVLLTNFLKSWKLAFLKLRVNAVICTATAGLNTRKTFGVLKNCNRLPRLVIESLSADTQSPMGHHSGQLALADPAWARAWIRWSPDVPSNFNPPVKASLILGCIL